MERTNKALEILKAGTVIPATPLALDDNGNFDKERQKLLTRYYLEAGVGGIATAVHSTQFEIRDPEVNLFETVIKTVSETIDEFEKETGKTIVKICGACGMTEQAVKEAQTAKELGFDAVLLSPGGLSAFDEDYLIERTKEVAKIMPVIGFYLQPAVGGRIFTYSYWEKVCAVDNVVAIKAAPFDRYLTYDVVRAAAMSKRCDEITLYTGNDDNIVADLITKYSFDKNGKTITKKFEGGLLGHWCVWTNKVVALLNDIKNENYTCDILTLGSHITDANGVIFDAKNGFSGCIPGIHEILRRQGLLKSIRCINPDEKLSPGQSEELDRIYKMYPDLNDDEFVKEFLKKYEA